MKKIFDLPVCSYDRAKSFYGKAKIIETENGEKVLQSYNTFVCRITAAGRFVRMWDGYSVTTMRHVNSFLSFYDMNGGGKSWWDMQPVETENERLIIMTNIEKLYQSIESEKQRSAWNKGVTQYALEMVEQLGEQIGGGYFDELDLSDLKKVRAALRNGAADWRQYSWGGSALIYNGDIAERLCNPSELKKTRNGERRPNSREEWLDVQARALFQAANRVCRHIRTLEKSGAISYTVPF